MDTDADAVHEAAAELYGLPRDEFTAHRDERVRRERVAGRRELAAAIKALRRPTVAAWLVNQLARTSPAELAALDELGASLRAAHEHLDGEAIRELSGRRRALIDGLVRAAARLGGGAGVAVSEAARRELDEIFSAALAEPTAARAVASGRLSSTRELTDEAAAHWPAIAPDARARPVALPAAATPRRRAERPEPAKPTGPSPALRRAQAELAAAEDAEAQARSRHAEAERGERTAADDEAAAQREVARLRAELADAEQAQQRAGQRVRFARRAREDAERGLRDAGRRTELARERRDALEH